MCADSDTAVAEQFLARVSEPSTWYGVSAYGTGDVRGAITDAAHISLTASRQRHAHHRLTHEATRRPTETFPSGASPCLLIGSHSISVLWLDLDTVHSR